jgi:hypothetical protein
LNGYVRIVGDPTTCKNYEDPMSWSVAGPQGPTGMLGSFDELEGLACTRDGEAGTVAVSHTAAAAVLRCVTGTRFVDNGDGTVLDTQTGLQWDKKTASGCTVTDAHCVNNTFVWSSTGTAPDGTLFFILDRVNGRLCIVTDVNCQGLAGHSDWRVPTFAELQTIVDTSVSGCGSGTPCINATFGPTVSAHYWSSS